MSIILIIILSLVLRNFYLILKRIKRKRKKYIIKNISSISLGSSHSDCIFKYLENNLNLSLASQTFYYDYLLLKEYITKVQKNTSAEEINCFLTISYFSFYGEKTWSRDLIEKYYLALPLKDFKGKDILLCFIFKYFPIFYKFFSFKEKTKKNFLEDYVTYRIKKHVEYLKNGKNTVFNLKLLEKIIQLCKENKINLILLTPPFQKEYNNFFEEDLLEMNFYSKVRKVCLRYSIVYLDYSHDYKNFNKKEYFQSQDYDHLSFEGAKIVINLLNNKIKNKLKLKGE